VKYFLRFHAATSLDKITHPTADSVDTFAKLFFAGFTRVTGTPTDAEERSVQRELPTFIPTVVEDRQQAVPFAKGSERHQARYHRPSRVLI